MTAYYNEIDPLAAAWLRELIKAGHIAPGEVDERSIIDIRPADLAGFTQCHFFAGIGVWSYSLRRAGWADSTPIWTGSCPCQPFSAAGKGAGFDDERHLWSHFHYLIEQCQPAVVAGEQVASKDGLAWLDLVQADMEATGYAFGAVDTCAAGFGAPHIRQRLYWIGERLAQSEYGGREVGQPTEAWRSGAAMPSGSVVRLADNQRIDGRREHGGCVDGAQGESEGEARQRKRLRPDPADGCTVDGVADDNDGRCAPQLQRGSAIQFRGEGQLRGPRAGLECSSTTDRASPTNGLWRDPDWLFCRDGKWRPVEPGTFPLAHGAAARVGRLRGYGNAINAEQAQGFIEAYLETRRVAANDNYSIGSLTSTPISRKASHA